MTDFRDLDGERLLTGSALIYPDDLPTYRAAGFTFGVAPLLITDGDLQLVWRAIDAFEAKGIAANERTVRNALIDKVPAPFLSALVEGVPRLPGQTIGFLVEKLTTLARCRRFQFEERAAIAQLAERPELINNGLIAYRQQQLAALAIDVPGLTSDGLDAEALADATLVVAEGKQIAATGVPYLVDGLVPAYGMLGMAVAFAKVGKTTFGQQLAAAVATGRSFLGRPTQQTRVLIIAAEDPPEYTAWLARHLDVPPDVLTFYRRPHLLDARGRAQISATVHEGRYGLVLIASWQAVVRGLIRDENDNAGAVRVVEEVKKDTRETRVPWLIDAHSGKGEDQSDDADPSRAMRGASGAPASADYTLSLRYANGPYGGRRRLSGKGRFVNVAPLVLDYDDRDGTYTVIGSTKDAAIETTWRLICETGALTTTPQSIDAIARTAGLVEDGKRCTGHARRQVAQALHGRDGIDMTKTTRGDKRTTLYALSGALAL